MSTCSTRKHPIQHNMLYKPCPVSILKSSRNPSEKRWTVRCSQFVTCRWNLHLTPCFMNAPTEGRSHTLECSGPFWCLLLVYPKRRQRALVERQHSLILRRCRSTATTLALALLTPGDSVISIGSVMEGRLGFRRKDLGVGHPWFAKIVFFSAVSLSEHLFTCF